MTPRSMWLAVDIWFDATRRLLEQTERGHPPTPAECRRMIAAIDEARVAVGRHIAIMDARESLMAPGAVMH
jgi:hypothetical protein